MKNLQDEFKMNACDLANLYRERKYLIKLIQEKESKIKELGKLLEFMDSLEESAQK